MNCNKCGKPLNENGVCSFCESGTDGVIKKKKKVKVGVLINTIICVILLFITTSLLISAITLKNIVVKSAETGKNKNSVIVQSIDDIDAQKLAKYLCENYIYDERITEENLVNIINDTDALDFVAENTQNYLDFINGKDKSLDGLTTDKVIQFIEDNKDVIKNETSLNFVDSDKEKIENEVGSILDDVNYNTEKNVSNLRTAVSLPGMIAIIVLMILIVMQLGFIYIKNSVQISKLFIISGITILVPAILVLGAGFICNMVIGNADTSASAFSPVFNTIWSAMILSGGTLTAVSLIVLICGVIIKIALNIINALKKKPEIVSLQEENVVMQVTNTMLDNNVVADSVPNQAVLEPSFAKEQPTACEQPVVESSAEPVMANKTAVNLSKDEAVSESAVQNTVSNVNEKIKTVQNADAIEHLVGSVEQEQQFDEKPAAIHVRFCTSCGAKLMQDACFCSKCGKPVNH